MQARFEFESAPGHLIRRAHQISVAMFAEETAGCGLTPVQFVILNLLMEECGVDQRTLAGRVGFDAATIGSVIGRLEKKGWLRRCPATHDRRRKLLWLTSEGAQAVAEMLAKVERVQPRILQPLSAAEGQQFMALLAKLVTGHARNPPA